MLEVYSARIPYPRILTDNAEESEYTFERFIVGESNKFAHAAKGGSPAPATS